MDFSFLSHFCFSSLFLFQPLSLEDALKLEEARKQFRRKVPGFSEISKQRERKLREGVYLHHYSVFKRLSRFLSRCQIYFEYGHT